MGRRKMADRNIRKLLRHSSGSMQVTLPIEFIRALKWRNKQKVVIKKSGKRLIIEDWVG